MPLLIIMSCIPVSITKSDLKELYNKKKLNTYQIASIYNCCQATIWKRLHKFNIKTRASGNSTDLDEKKLKNLYIGKKLSTWQIEKLYGYPRGTVYRKLNEYNIKTRNISESHIVYARTNFSGNKIEKAYIIGFAIGDLRIRKRSKKSKTVNIDCGSTKVEQINLIKKLFSRYGRVWVSKPNKRDAVQIECFLNNSFSFLLKKRKKIDNWIIKNKKYFLSFIAGFTDAEGCMSITKRGMGYYSLGNYNKTVLTQIRNFLIEEGIIIPKLRESKIKGRVCFKKYFHNQNYWQLTITKKKSLLNLFRLVGQYIKHFDKIRSMRKVVSNINKRNKKFGYLKMN